MKKHILCIGDSNTHGYCADPGDCADGGIRFNEEERWTCLLQKGLGEDFLVTEEGLSGRTTVFDDPLYEDLNVFRYFWGLLKSHEYLDLLIIMLGTNDCKERFHANPATIAWGMERLCRKAMQTDCWAPGCKPNILIVAPPPVLPGVETSRVSDEVGAGCVEKSEKLADYYRQKADLLGLCFLDAAGCEFNGIDFMHLTRRGHRQLADRFLEIIPKIL